MGCMVNTEIVVHHVGIDTLFFFSTYYGIPQFSNFLPIILVTHAQYSQNKSNKNTLNTTKQQNTDLIRIVLKHYRRI